MPEGPGTQSTQQPKTSRIGDDSVTQSSFDELARHERLGQYFGRVPDLPRASLAGVFECSGFARSARVVMVDVACLVAANAVDTPRILVVEDGEPESPTALAVRAALRAEGYEVEIAIGASEGLRRFVSQPPALVLLNARRPRTPWIEMCKRMQAVDDVPIIIGFHLPSQIDTVLAFELGAAGYISEPNRLQELVARIRAALRVSRTTRPRPSPRSIRTLASREDRFVVDALSVDFAGREVTVAGERVHLSRLEFDLLALLLSPPDVVRTRDEIIERIWSDRKITGSRTLDTHVRRLRLKLGEDPASSGHLVTVRGVGFRFDTDGHKGRLPTGC